MENGDNLRVRVIAGDRETMELALRVAFAFHGKAVAYTATSEHGLVLLWATVNGDGSTPLPYPLTADTATEFCWRWLEANRKSASPHPDARYLDHDGDNVEGFEVYNEDLGHVGNRRAAICGVRPAYIWMGK